MTVAVMLALKSVSDRPLSYRALVDRCAPAEDLASLDQVGVRDRLASVRTSVNGNTGASTGPTWIVRITNPRERHTLYAPSAYVPKRPTRSGARMPRPCTARSALTEACPKKCPELGNSVLTELMEPRRLPVVTTIILLTGIF